MFARARELWNKKVGPAFRDARGRAGDLTAFILTLKGVYQVPMKSIGFILAGVTAATPFIFFYKNLKNPSVSISPENVVDSSSQEIQRQLQQQKNNEFIKYLDCCISFLGQFGTHHMEMMIASATTGGVDYVDYEWLANPKNFGMLLYMVWAVFNSCQSFQERKASYEKNPQITDRVSAAALTRSSIGLYHAEPARTESSALEVKIEQPIGPR